MGPKLPSSLRIALRRTPGTLAVAEMRDLSGVVEIQILLRETGAGLDLAVPNDLGSVTTGENNEPRASPDHGRISGLLAALVPG